MNSCLSGNTESEQVEQKPEVQLLFPRHGETFLEGTQMIEFKADAFDEDGHIKRVEFLIDGAVVAEDRTHPYTYEWPVMKGGRLTFQ